MEVENSTNSKASLHICGSIFEMTIHLIYLVMALSFVSQSWSFLAPKSGPHHLVSKPFHRQHARPSNHRQLQHQSHLPSTSKTRLNAFIFRSGSFPVDGTNGNPFDIFGEVLKEFFGEGLQPMQIDSGAAAAQYEEITKEIKKIEKALQTKTEKARGQYGAEAVKK